MNDLIAPHLATVHRGRRTRRSWAPVARGLHRDPTASALLAWQQVLPASAAFSHLTAASLHGWWLPQLPPGTPVLVDQAEHDHRTRRQGIRVTRTRGHVPTLALDGLRVATPPHTLLACARDVGLLDLVVLVDAALRSGCTTTEIRDVCTPRRRGVVRLRQALELADGRSESAWESLLRVMHVVLGADVVPQHPVARTDGTHVARADLWLRGTTTIHEYDGADHRDADQHGADLRRDRALTSIGWTRRGYVAADLRENPVGVLRDIDETLGRPHDPTRVRPWLALMAESTFTPAGRARLARRLART